MSLSTTQYGYIVDPMVPFTDDKGKTIKNGFIRVFMAGTSTPVLTYRNYDGATNQEKIELDNSGRVMHNVIGSKGSLYKVVVYNILHSQENPLLTVDKIAVLGASINASGATIVTGLDSVTVQEENFLKATVEGTGVELALDPTEVTSEVSTTADAVTAGPDYVVPLLEKTGTGDGKKISLANLFKFALDWISRLATTVTSFASGDFIAVSNTTDGARKMPKDTLLELTAQNALASNVAPAFSSLKNYRNGDFCINRGVNLRAAHDITAGEFDSSDWEHIDEDSATKVRITSANVSSYNDVNNFPVGYSVECMDSTLLSSISHKPSNELFSCYTFKARSYDVNTQIAVTASKKTFIRSSFGTWGNWIDIGDFLKCGSLAPLFDSSKNYGVGVPVEFGSELYVSTRPNPAGSFNSGFWAKTNLFSFGKLRLSSGNVSYYNDINNYPLGSSISCLDAGLAASVSHKPVEDTFVCFTLNSRESDANIQIFVGNTDKRIFIRSSFGTWGNWIEIKSQSESASINPLAAFDNLVCIGDSLTYCAVYTGLNTVRQAYKTWPDILANACDATAQSIAVGGDDAITSWGRVQTDLVAKTNALAIVYLGTNLGLTDTLSTDAPENTQYINWANTETGCYAKIVAKAQDLGYKVLLIKPWNSSGDLAVTQKVVGDVGTRFGCCVIGPFHTDELKYHYWPNLQDTNHTHYNDLGYAWFASVLPSEVASAASNQLKYIIPS